MCVNWARWIYVCPTSCSFRTLPVMWDPNPPLRHTPRCHKDPKTPGTTKVVLFRQKRKKTTAWPVSKQTHPPLLMEALQKRCFWCAGLFHAGHIYHALLSVQCKALFLCHGHSGGTFMRGQLCASQPPTKDRSISQRLTCTSQVM